VSQLVSYFPTNHLWTKLAVIQAGGYNQSLLKFPQDEGKRTIGRAAMLTLNHVIPSQIISITPYAEEVRQEAGPDVIWAAWLHSFHVWTSHCLYLGLYLGHDYLYLRLYLRGTVHCLLAYCLVNPKNWSLWWKLGGTAVKKPQVWSPLGLYRHMINYDLLTPLRVREACLNFDAHVNDVTYWSKQALVAMAIQKCHGST